MYFTLKSGSNKVTEMVASIPAILLLAIAQSISSKTVLANSAHLLMILVFRWNFSCPGASNHHHPITRIVGGHQVNITDAPWQVSLEYRGKHLCGGSIISNRWIVTAAKCLPYDTNDWQFMKVRVGTGDKEKNGQLLEVDKTVMHPRWTPVNMDYDFGLILLDDALEFTDRIRPIRLAAADYAIATGTKCLVTGWGLTNHPDQSTNKLRGVMVPIVDQHTCQRAHAAYMTFQPRMICAGDFEHGGIDGQQIYYVVSLL